MQKKEAIIVVLTLLIVFSIATLFIYGYLAPVVKQSIITGKAAGNETNETQETIYRTNCSEPDWCDGADLNQDGVVTYAELKEYFNPPAPEPSPEEQNLQDNY